MDSEAIKSRDARVLQMLADGSTYREAAESLHCSEQSLKERIHRLRRRLGASNTTNLVATAIRQGVID